MRVVYHRLAEEEVIENARYLERKSPGLGSRFLDAVDEAAQRIAKTPDWFEVVDKDIRRATVNGFPYSIFFRVALDVVRILTIKHHSRSADYWTRRR